MSNNKCWVFNWQCIKNYNVLFILFDFILNRKLISSSDSFDNSDNSSDDSGSSSKYFKKSPKRIKKNKDSYFDSISSSSDESNLRPYNGKKRRQSWVILFLW